RFCVITPEPHNVLRMEMNLVIRSQNGRELWQTVESANNARTASLCDSDPHMLRRDRLPILLYVISIPEDQLHDVSGLNTKACVIIWNWVSKEWVVFRVVLLDHLQLVAVLLKLRVWIWRRHGGGN